MHALHYATLTLTLTLTLTRRSAITSWACSRPRSRSGGMPGPWACSIGSPLASEGRSRKR
eukprot:scaffold52696_cov39-Phaeocystis_antarctica.AAC.3